jgi:hypothetical protein
MMMAVRDHRGAAAGPVTHEDFVTCLHLAPLPGTLWIKHSSWMSPREFPALKPKSQCDRFLGMDYGSRYGPPDYALVHRAAQRLGLQPLDESLMKGLLSVLFLVRSCL